MAALSEAVNLETWKEIVASTVKAAKRGDAKARDWLSRYLLGSEPLPLSRLATDEIADPDGEEELLEMLARRFHRDCEVSDELDDEDFEQARRQLMNFKRRLRTAPSASR